MTFEGPYQPKRVRDFNEVMHDGVVTWFLSGSSALNLLYSEGMDVHLVKMLFPINQFACLHLALQSRNLDHHIS